MIGINPLTWKEQSEQYVETVTVLAKLADAQAEKKITTVMLADHFKTSKDVEELGQLFTHYGSDKANVHNYYLAYGSLVKRELPLSILEIGLGTNNTNFRSNMGKDGKPGASLRAFRDWAPQARVYGADIDKGILFTEERIQTYFVDQLRPETLTELVTQLPKQGFDLIIDDGLHLPVANLNTLEFSLKLLKPGGFFVVEDILEQYLPIWKIVVSLLSDTYRTQLFEATGEKKPEYVLVVEKNK